MSHPEEDQPPNQPPKVHFQTGRIRPISDRSPHDLLFSCLKSNLPDFSNEALRRWQASRTREYQSKKETAFGPLAQSLRLFGPRYFGRLLSDQRTVKVGTLREGAMGRFLGQLRKSRTNRSITHRCSRIGLINAPPPFHGGNFSRYEYTKIRTGC